MNYCYQCGHMTRGRTALLQHLRPKLRRETLPAPAPESARRGGLLEVRQPRTLDAAAEDSDESGGCSRILVRLGLGLLLFYASLSV